MPQAKDKLSHGGRFYRAQAERDRERKRIDTARVASTARPILRRRPEESARWPSLRLSETRRRPRRERVEL